VRSLLFALAILLASPSAIATEDNSAVYHLSGDIREGRAESIRELARWARRGGARELLILIDSNGGNAQEGLAIFNAIHSSGISTKCIVEGTASSAASLALMGCQVRVAKKDSIVIFHNPIVGIDRPGAITVEMAADMDLKLSTLADAYAAIVACRLGISVQEYRRKIANGALWTLNASEALQARVVDMVSIP
jgi:ATP-dependent protease ClpP protease subunit